MSRFKLVLIAVYVFTFPNSNHAQEDGKEKYYHLVQLLQPTNFSLNKVVNFGKSSTQIPINLPPNTIKWIYTLRSNKIEQKSESNLIVELTNLFSKGIFTDLAKSITAPSGVIVSNISINDGGIISDGSRSMILSGVVEVIPKFQRQIITLENPNLNESINIQIEAVAIVFDKEGYDKNQLDKSIRNLSSAISELSESSKKSREEKQSKEIADMKSYLDLAYLKLDNEDYNSAINIFLELTKKLRYFDFIAYQGLGTAYRMSGEYGKAISAYQKSIKLNENSEIFKAKSYGGMGLTYLLMNDEIKANNFCAEAISHCKGESGIEEKKFMIKAIEKALAKKLSIKGSDDIIKLLSN